MLSLCTGLWNVGIVQKTVAHVATLSICQFQALDMHIIEITSLRSHLRVMPSLLLVYVSHVMTDRWISRKKRRYKLATHTCFLIDHWFQLKRISFSIIILSSYDKLCITKKVLYKEQNLQLYTRQISDQEVGINFLIFKRSISMY